MGHSFLYARKNTGLLWHTAVRPSVHASYDNISHLFPLLLIGHVVACIVLIKGPGEQVRGVILVSLENASFHMVYTINWFKKCSILITVLQLSQRGRGGGAYHGTVHELFILSYSYAVSFRDIRGHLGTIPSIVTFYICACRRRRL